MNIQLTNTALIQNDDTLDFLFYATYQDLDSGLIYETQLEIFADTDCDYSTRDRDISTNFDYSDFNSVDEDDIEADFVELANNRIEDDFQATQLSEMVKIITALSNYRIVETDTLVGVSTYFKEHQKSMHFVLVEYQNEYFYSIYDRKNDFVLTAIQMFCGKSQEEAEQNLSNEVSALRNENCTITRQNGFSTILNEAVIGNETFTNYSCKYNY